MEEREGVESIVREIKRKTRRRYNSKEKTRIVLEGLRGEDSIASLCRKEGINPNTYYKWSCMSSKGLGQISPKIKRRFS